MLELIKS